MDELLEPFAKLLEAVVTPAAVRAVENGGAVDTMWAAIAESGFLDALVAEEHGGAGLSLADIEGLTQSLGAYAVPVPVAETMVARALLAAAGIAAPDGPIALAGSAVAGQVVPLGLVADSLLVDDGRELVLAKAADCGVEPTGVFHSLSARIGWEGNLVGQRLPRPAGGLRALAAVLRTGLIAGAAARLTDITTAYANDRKQFGKPLGKQQVLQQMLAVMAEDMIAARIASQLGSAAVKGDFSVDLPAVAAAKSVASTLAPRVAATAHAVHGAIGVSEELDVQLYTRRLHEWRLADGSETYWNAALGTARLDDDRTSVEWLAAAQA